MSKKLFLRNFYVFCRMISLVDVWFLVKDAGSYLGFSREGGVFSKKFRKPFRPFLGLSIWIAELSQSTKLPCFKQFLCGAGKNLKKTGLQGCYWRMFSFLENNKSNRIRVGNFINQATTINFSRNSLKQKESKS